MTYEILTAFFLLLRTFPTLFLFDLPLKLDEA